MVNWWLCKALVLVQRDQQQGHGCRDPDKEVRAHRACSNTESALGDISIHFRDQWITEVLVQDNSEVAR